MFKNLLAVATFVVGSSAFAACPDLAGDFMCSIQGQQFVLSIGQKVDQKGVTTYTVGDFEAIADGQSHRFDFGDGVEDYTATCQNNRLVYEYTDTLKDGSVEQGKQDLYRNDKKQLVIEDSGYSVTCDLM